MIVFSFRLRVSSTSFNSLLTRMAKSNDRTSLSSSKKGRVKSIDANLRAIKPKAKQVTPNKTGGKANAHRPKSKAGKKSASSSSNKSTSSSSSAKSRPSSKKTVGSLSSTKKSAASVGFLRRKPTSILSMASQYNQSTGRYTPEPNVSEALEAANADQHYNQYGVDLFDSVVVYMLCPVHQKVALTMVADKGQFLPWGPINNGQSWLSSAAKLILKILQLKKRQTDEPFFTEPICLDVLRLQLPIYYEFVSRITYKVELTQAGCKAGCCKGNKYIAWFDVADLKSMMKSKSPEQYLGPEPVLFHALALKDQGADCREVTLLDALLYHLADDSVSAQAELLKSVGYVEEDLLKIYGDYLQHSYPSEFLTIRTLQSYLDKVELKLCKNDKYDAVFRAFAFNSSPGYINFNEFLLGLAMVDKLNGSILVGMTGTSGIEDEEAVSNVIEMNNSKKSGKTKSKVASALNKPSAQLDKDQALFIFRYYAKTNPAHLTEDEFSQAMAKYKVPEAEVNKFKQKKPQGGKVSREDFEQLAGALARSVAKNCASGSSLFNTSQVSPLAHLRIRQCYPALSLRVINRNSERMDAIKAKLARRNLCDNCRQKQYTLSCYMVKMSSEGLIYEPVPNKHQEDVNRMSKVKRTLSEHYFTRKFVCNQLLDIVRKFAEKLKFYKPSVKISAPDWATERGNMVNKICSVCKEARAIFEKVPRVIKVTSPCYVIGDIHGNLRDLLIYEKVLWKLGPYFNPANYLFLGDYVDRGAYGIECALYLLCLKLLAPDRIFMLRGNHECRTMQREYSFYAECLEKFGPKDGETIFEAFNSVFDCLPICALIDESIYCAHGGIPSCAAKVEQILTLPCPLQDPDNESEIAMEILWNDPMTDQEYRDLVKNNEEAKESAATVQQGFMANTKRGTGMYYSERALKTFLEGNSLTHVIRAHEVIPAGYQYHMGGRCLTIFSCSYYCEGINEAAVAFVHDSKIRVIKVDTGSKEDASVGQ